MPVTNNKPLLDVGVAPTLEGVYLFALLPDGTRKPLLLLAPDFAREIAQSLTLRSFEVEDMRGEAK